MLESWSDGCSDLWLSMCLSQKDKSCVGEGDLCFFKRGGLVSDCFLIAYLRDNKCKPDCKAIWLSKTESKGPRGCWWNTWRRRKRSERNQTLRLNSDSIWSSSQTEQSLLPVSSHTETHPLTYLTSLSSSVSPSAPRWTPHHLVHWCVAVIE